MDKAVQAYPLMKSRTKIFPNAAVAKHLLTDIQITEEERNSAIDFLLERDWLMSTGVSLYTIAESGLFAFYTELAQLHVANADYSEAVMCYEQAYWLDSSQHHLRYQQVICHTEAEAWDAAVEMLTQLPTEVPEDVNLVAYHTAVAQSYHQVYQTTQDENTKQKVIEACETVLRLDKKSREISKLLASYQGKKVGGVGRILYGSSYNYVYIQTVGLSVVRGCGGGSVGYEGGGRMPGDLGASPISRWVSVSPCCVRTMSSSSSEALSSAWTAAVLFM